MAQFITSNSSWIGLPKVSALSRARLFCFPYSGAGASIFFPWTNTLSASCEVCPVQYPGRGTRMSEPLLTNLSDLVAGAAEGLQLFFDRPFAFFGHSLGAIVAFELARYLRRQGLPQPVHLFASGHPAPHLPDPEPGMYTLSDADFIVRLKEMNGMSEDFWQNPELVQMVLPVLRADFTACETYRHDQEDPLTVPITALGGLADPDVTRSDLEAWQQHTSAAFALRMFPGDHFYLNNNRFLLLQAIARDLEQSLRKTIPGR